MLIDAPTGSSDWIRDLGVRLDLLVLTHGHLDHFDDAAKIKQICQCQVACHKDGIPLITDPDFFKDMRFLFRDRTGATGFSDRGDSANRSLRHSVSGSSCSWPLSRKPLLLLSRQRDPVRRRRSFRREHRPDRLPGRRSSIADSRHSRKNSDFAGQYPHPSWAWTSNDHRRRAPKQSISAVVSRLKNPSDQFNTDWILQYRLDFSFAQLHRMAGPDNFPAFIHQKSGWNRRDSKLLEDRSRRVDRHVVIHWDLLLKFLNGSLVFVRDSDNLQSPAFVFGVDLVQVRNAFPAGRAPGGPKLNQKRFSSELRLFAQIIQGKGRKLCPLLDDKRSAREWMPPAIRSANPLKKQ